MIVIGLTGSIASGKSETARMFAAEGIPVLDSDEVVHRLYAPGGAAVAAVAARFPGVERDGGIDRRALSARLQADPQDFPALEAIVHPHVWDEQEMFVEESRSNDHRAVILEVPLLFEAGRENTVDKIIVVTCGEEERLRRALQRPGMTEEKFRALLARQVPDRIKMSRADFVVDTSKGLDDARRQVKAIVWELDHGDRHA